MQLDHQKFLEQFELRVVHTGGDYGNFLCWGLGWLDDLNYQSIENVITDNGSAHNHRDNFINRYDEYHLTNANTTSGIVRLHYNINDIKHDILEIADIGPTVVIDPTNCLIELINNRQTKMPAGSFRKITQTLMLEKEISTFQNVVNKINSVEHPNLRVVKMKQLVNRPVNTLTALYQWWKQKDSVRSNNELDECINFWQGRQEYLNQDEKILALFRDKNSALNDKIPEMLKEKIKQDITQLKSLSSIDGLIYHDCLKKLPIASQEFRNFYTAPGVKTMYKAILSVADNERKKYAKLYADNFGQDYEKSTLLMHQGTGLVQSLIQMLNYTTETENLFRAVSIDSFCKHLEKNNVTPGEWIEYLQTRNVNILMLHNTNFELEDALRTAFSKKGNESAADIVTNVFFPSKYLNNIIENENVEKINVHQVTSSLSETISQICKYANLPVKYETDSYSITDTYWQCTEFTNIDEEYNKIHGSFASYAKYKKLVEYVKEFNDHTV